MRRGSGAALGLNVEEMSKDRLPPSRLVISIVLSLVLAPHLLAQQDQPQNPALSRELIEMGEKDQRYQPQMVELMKSLSDPAKGKEFASVAEKQNVLNAENIKRLEEIINQYGWPTRSLVGKDAAGAAFLIVQHADLEYQKKYFNLIKDAAARNEARPGDAAMLEDRILMREGRKQIYGTQVRTNDATKKLELVPIEDEANVDARRAKVGMPPLREYLKAFGIDYQPPKP